MRYVSDIVTSSGHVDGLMYATLANSGLAYVTVQGDDFEARFTSETLHNVDCYGVTLSGGVIVKHSQKTATLHRFVNSAWTVGTNPKIDLSACDWVNMEEKVRCICGKSMIAINTFDEDIRVVGRQGSVAVRQSKVRGTRDAMTLYDLLGSLSRELGVNLMSYNKITFYSGHLFYVSEVGLAHNAESDRYFAKMYLDVCGGGNPNAICVRSGV